MRGGLAVLGRHWAAGKRRPFTVGEGVDEKLETREEVKTDDG